MNASGTLRFLDRYVGKLLCWFLSAPNLWASKRQLDKQKVNKVLLVELFEMGAAIMLAPSLHYLRNEIPKADLYCLTTEDMKESWKVLKFVPLQNIVTLKDNGFLSFMFSTIWAVIRMRKTYFDLVIDYDSFFRVSALLVALFRSKAKAGFYRYQLEGLGRGRIYNIACSFNQNMHIAKNFLALTKTALQGRCDYPNFKDPIQTEDLILPLYHTDEGSRQSVLLKLAESYPPGIKDRILVVSHDVGPNLPIRNFPPERFVEVIKQVLQKNNDLSVVLVGTQKEARSARWICMQVSDKNCICLVGNTTFRELLELLKIATVVLCNDNGIGHFAALTRTKTISLFSTDSPFIYGPLGSCTILYSFFHCSPCISALNHKNSKCVDNKCLQAISSDTVSEYVQQALDGQFIPGTINNKIPYIL